MGTKTKHAPGPWAIGHRDEEWDDEKDDMVPADTVSSIVAADGTKVCGTCDGCNKISLGNANLIAAAPDLKEALKGLLEATNALLDLRRMSPEARKDLGAVNATRAALAKAEGQS